MSLYRVSRRYAQTAPSVPRGKAGVKKHSPRMSQLTVLNSLQSSAAVLSQQTRWRSAKLKFRSGRCWKNHSIRIRMVALTRQQFPATRIKTTVAPLAAQIKSMKLAILKVADWAVSVSATPLFLLKLQSLLRQVLMMRIVLDVNLR